MQETLTEGEGSVQLTSLGCFVKKENLVLVQKGADIS
jgi:hypothetical protein